MGTPSDANRVKIRWSREATWGETPSGPATTAFRATSESLTHNKETVVSQEIRSDRQRADVLQVFKSADGDIGFELSYSNFEEFFENALRSTIASARVAAASVTVAASTITGPAGTNYKAAFEAGQWVRMKATGTASSGVVAQIASLTSTVITVTGTTLTAGVRTSAAVIGRTLKNGTTKRSYFIEVENEDISDVRYFTGMRVDRATLDIQSQRVIVGTFTFMGKRGYTASTSVASTTTSAGTQTPLTAAVNVAQLFENGRKLTNAVTGVNVAVANNMRSRPQVGQDSSAEYGDGGIDVTGSLNLYYEGKEILDKLINHTQTSFALQMKDAHGNVIVITIPALHFARGAPVTPGQDQDVFLPLDFTAFRGSGGHTIRMDFLPSP